MSAHFDRLASRYDELRPVDEHWWELFELLVSAGDLRGRRVLELGAGTGRLSQALAEQAHAKAWAVDASAEMVAEARANGVTAKLARAEALPFRTGSFDRVVARMAVHLFDRPAAFVESFRVLRADEGRLAIATEDPSAFDRHWLTPFFPSLPEVERARFPDESTLRTELTAAGFARVSFERLTQARRSTRDRALAVVRGRAFSTFDLLSPAEYAAGLTRMESELDGPFDHTFSWLVAVADASVRTGV